MMNDGVTKINLSGLLRKHVERSLRHYRRMLAAKQIIAARHAPGTAYYDRAIQEARTALEAVELCEAELLRRDKK